MGCEKLSPEQAKIVKETWDIVRNEDQLATGIGMYIRMFTQHPEVMSMFSFVETKDLEELKKSPRFHKHVLNLMKSVGKAVDTLEDMEAFEKYFVAMGKRHIKYGAESSQFDLVGEALTYTVAQTLGDRFTPERQEAFGALYAVITHYVNDGLQVKASE